MPKRIYISNGTSVNAAWTEQIAVSYDGANWTTLYKNGLSVHPATTGSGITNPPNVLGNQTRENRIYLKDLSGFNVLSFNCAHVVNQAAWNARTDAALQQAVTDLTTWIAT